jgi:hypothetical protein
MVIGKLRIWMKEETNTCNCVGNYHRYSIIPTCRTVLDLLLDEENAEKDNHGFKERKIESEGVRSDPTDKDKKWCYNRTKLQRRPN